MFFIAPFLILPRRMLSSIRLEAAAAAAAANTPVVSTALGSDPKLESSLPRETYNIVANLEIRLIATSNAGYTYIAGTPTWVSRNKAASVREASFRTPWK